MLGCSEEGQWVVETSIAQDHTPQQDDSQQGTQYNSICMTKVLNNGLLAGIDHTLFCTASVSLSPLPSPLSPLPSPLSPPPLSPPPSPLPAPVSMYVYEGEDYSKSSDSDKKSFDQLLAGKEESIFKLLTLLLYLYYK